MEESPSGGSTPRSTPSRMSSAATRGTPSLKPHQSSSLLEEVLAEKKMALLRSPEVLRWLQQAQKTQQQQHPHRHTNPTPSQPTPTPRSNHPPATPQANHHHQQQMYPAQYPTLTEETEDTLRFLRSTMDEMDSLTYEEPLLNHGAQVFLPAAHTDREERPSWMNLGSQENLASYEDLVSGDPRMNMEAPEPSGFSMWEEKKDYEEMSGEVKPQTESYFQKQLDEGEYIEENDEDANRTKLVTQWLHRHQITNPIDAEKMSEMATEEQSFT